MSTNQATPSVNEPQSEELAQQRARSEQQARKEEDARAQAERELDMAALQALPRRERERLVAAQLAANPHAPRAFIERLAARDARRNSLAPTGLPVDQVGQRGATAGRRRQPRR